MHTPFIDTAIDLAGRRWYANDRVLHTMPGRSDAGRITGLYAGAVVRCQVTFDDGGTAPVYFSELVLISRRTADDMPCAAADVDAVVYCERCQLATHPAERCERIAR